MDSGIASDMIIPGITAAAGLAYEAWNRGSSALGSSTHGKYKSSGVDGASESSFKYKARKSVRETKFDRVNCQHGIIQTHSTGLVTGKIDKISYLTLADGSVANEFHSYNAMTQIRAKLADNTSSVDSGALNGYPRELFKVDWFSREYIIVNEQNDGCYFTLYDLKMKKVDGMLNPGAPETQMSGFFDTGEGADQTYWNALVTQKWDDPDVNVKDCLAALQTYYYVNTTRFFLRPGEVHKHKTFYRCNYVFDKFQHDYANATTNHKIPELYNAVLVRCEGKPVQRALTPTSIGINAPNYAYVVKTKVHIHQVLPFYDKFHWNNANWINKDADPTLFSTTVEIDHATETMK